MLNVVVTNVFNLPNTSLTQIITTTPKMNFILSEQDEQVFLAILEMVQQKQRRFTIYCAETGTCNSIPLKISFVRILYRSHRSQ